MSNLVRLRNASLAAAIAIALLMLLIIGVKHDKCAEACLPAQTMRTDHACYCAVSDGWKLKYKDSNDAKKSK